MGDAKQAGPSFKELFAAALNRRVGNHRPIGKKQFAHDMQVSVVAVDQWLSGNSAPSGPLVVVMLNYFDASFPREIGIEAEVVKLSDARYAAAVKLNRAVEEWKATG